AGSFKIDSLTFYKLSPVLATSTPLLFSIRAGCFIDIVSLWQLNRPGNILNV
ncbi:hypothetical protein L9F63_021034, partial [Diploptera punctata]